LERCDALDRSFKLVWSYGSPYAPERKLDEISPAAVNQGLATTPLEKCRARRIVMPEKLIEPKVLVHVRCELSVVEMVTTKDDGIDEDSRLDRR
jgi:hypothetical protein